MPAATLTVGNVEITAILDVDTMFPLAEVFDGSGDPLPGGSESLAATYPDEFTADMWRFRDHCFLVRTPTRLTLIDTGAGPTDSAFGRWLGVGGTLPDELAALGVMPNDVDSDVILTHIHSDHTGWNTIPSSSGWIPRFSNARYYLHGADITWMRGSVDEDEIREFAEVIAPLESSGAARHLRRRPRGGARPEPATRAGSHPGTPLRAVGHRRRAGALRGRPPALHVPAERPGFRSSGDVDPEEGSPHSHRMARPSRGGGADDRDGTRSTVPNRSDLREGVSGGSGPARETSSEGGPTGAEPVACSNACAARNTPRSSPQRPRIWIPIGSPSSVNPHGTETAGLPVSEICQHDSIQSM